MDKKRPDADELLEIGQLTLKWFRESGRDSLKPIEVIEALYGRTQSYLGEGVDIADTQVTAAELNALVKGKREGEDSGDVARRYVSENLRKYQDLLAEHGPEIDGYLRQRGKTQRLTISSTESQGRHKKQYYLDLEPMEGKLPSAPDSEDSSPQVVNYRVRQLPKPLPWARPFLSITLTGWRRWVYLLSVLAAILGSAAVLLLVLAAGLLAPISAFVLAGIVGLVVAGAIPFLNIADRSVIMAPGWLMGLNVNPAQLELRIIGRDADGDAVRQMRLVMYEAGCPLCQGTLNVVDGVGEFKGRLIGQCNNARTEHLYSFDHITKKGVPLRAYAYYG